MDIMPLLFIGSFEKKMFTCINPKYRHYATREERQVSEGNLNLTYTEIKTEFLNAKLPQMLEITWEY